MIHGIFRIKNFFAAAWLWLPIAIAGTQSFSPSVAECQDQNPVSILHVIDRERGLVEIVGPVQLEPDGLYSGSELVAAWLQIVGGNVGSELQVAFQSRLKIFGQPLYLLRSRLERGDWSAANVAAMQVEPLVGGEDLATRSLIQFARFRSNLAAGSPEYAAVPLLKLCRELNESTVPKDRLLAGLLEVIDTELAISGLLVPVWNNRARAASAWAAMQGELPSDRSGLPAGWYVYGVSLAIAADDLDGAEKLFNAWDPLSPENEAWKKILSGSLAVAMERLVVAETELNLLLETNRNGLSPLQSVTARWWLGVCRFRQNLALSPRSSFREMISMAADCENEWPAVAESALLAALAVANDHRWGREGMTLERELELLRARRLRYNFPDRH